MGYLSHGDPIYATLIALAVAVFARTEKGLECGKLGEYVAHALKSLLAPVVGLSFFWGFFRFQSFFGALFPLASDGPATLFSPYALYLATLVAVSVFALIAERRFRARFGQNPGARTRRAIVGAATLLGTLATLGCLMCEVRLLPSWVVWICTPPVAVGFCAQYLAWASYCTRFFSARTILAMAGSFFLSLAGIVGLSRLSAELNNAVVLLTPLVSGLCLLAVVSQKGVVTAAQGPADRTAQPLCGELRLLANGLPFYAVLFVAFLLCGAVIRGIVDVGAAGDQGIRWPLSVCLSAAMFAVCLALYCRLGKEDAPADRLVEQFILIIWIAMAALFSSGVVWGIAAGSSETAGHLVVVARSILDFILLMLLCDMATRWNGRRSTLFIVLGMATEVVSWALSYMVVPALLSINVPDGQSVQNMLEFGALLALLLSMVAAFGAMGAFGNGGRRQAQMRPGTGSPLLGDDPAQEAPKADARISQITATYRLTPRETQVVELFSQGHSVKHVADLLGVSMGTVQSHLKGAYRKLGIHSRDELIELVRSKDV